MEPLQMFGDLQLQKAKEKRAQLMRCLP